jgi:dynein heavy chain 2, cytosolic
MPDGDSPNLFGLPLNIDRSCQIVISTQIISQLKILGRTSIEAGSKFDKDVIKKQFKPLWKLWESLKKVISSIKIIE